MADLASALAGRLGIDAGKIAAMPAKGVAHDHYRIAGQGLVIRVPKDLPWAAPALEHLAYETACFRRAEPSGVTPRLAEVLKVGPDLPRGALLVEEIVGRPVHLPGDLGEVAVALGRLHSVEIPPPAGRSPLPDHGGEGPSAATLALIAKHAGFLGEADISNESRQALQDEWDWAQAWVAGLRGSEPLALVGSDTHPGNFIIQPNGSARFVDLERVLYGSPVIDLAHASLPTSLSWDRSVTGEADRPDIVRFYRRYLDTVGPRRGEALKPWLMSARRLTWLRTMMWFVRWEAISAAGGLQIDDGLAAHIRSRIAAFLAPEAIRRMRAEWLEGLPLLEEICS